MSASEVAKYGSALASNKFRLACTPVWAWASSAEVPGAYWGGVTGSWEPGAGAVKAMLNPPEIVPVGA